MADVRGKAFRRLCAVLGRDYEGLASAARFARKAGVINTAWCRRLTRLDEAYAIVRHLSLQRSDRFVSELESFLGAAAFDGKKLEVEGGGAFSRS